MSLVVVILINFQLSKSRSPTATYPNANCPDIQQVILINITYPSLAIIHTCYTRKIFAHALLSVLSNVTLHQSNPAIFYIQIHFYILTNSSRSLDLLAVEKVLWCWCVFSLFVALSIYHTISMILNHETQ